jgi:apolipoprotein N-acyltransferase
MHLVGAAFLSVETRRPQVRATNTGISAVIDATGEIVATAGVDERAVLAEAVRPLAAPPTVVVRLGEWVGPAGLVVAALFLAIDALRSRKHRTDGLRDRRGRRAARR